MTKGMCSSLESILNDGKLKQFLERMISKRI